MTGRKIELAAMCRLEIRRTATLIRMRINDRHKEIADVIDGEFWSMLPRINGKSTSESDLPLLRELVLAELWPMTEDAPPPPKVASEPPFLQNEIGRRIDDDTWQRSGREQELLIEFAWHIEDAVNGACVKEEFLDKYVDGEIDGWRTTAVVPVSDSDRKFLHGYLRELIDEEYARVKGKPPAERNK